MQEIQPIHRGDRKPSPTHQQHRTESWYSLSVGGTGTESWRRHFRTSSNEISNAEMNTGMRRQADHREMITNAYESRRVTHYQANRKIPDEPTRSRHSSHDSGQSKPWTRNERESNQRTVWEKVSHRNNSLPCSTIRTVPVARYNSSELHQSAVLHRPHRKPDSAHSGKRTHKDPDSVPIGSHYHKLRGDGETVVVPYRPSTGTFEVTPQFKAASSTVNTGWIEPSSEKKRAKSPTLIHYHQLPSLTYKKARGFDKLDLLCSATLEIGEMYDNPTGCSCPKSRCVALYCDCFKAGRRCNPDKCKCVDCKNTVIESGADGARTKAIRCILGT